MVGAAIGSSTTGEINISTDRMAGSSAGVGPDISVTRVVVSPVATGTGSSRGGIIISTIEEIVSPAVGAVDLPMVWGAGCCTGRGCCSANTLTVWCAVTRGSVTTEEESSISRSLPSSLFPNVNVDVGSWDPNWGAVVVPSGSTGNLCRLPGSGFEMTAWDLRGAVKVGISLEGLPCEIADSGVRG